MAFPLIKPTFKVVDNVLTLLSADGKWRWDYQVDNSATAPVAAPATNQPVVTVSKGGTYPTLTAAVAALAPGGKILVADGTYGFAEASAQLGDALQSVTIAAVNPGRVTFDGQQFNSDGSNGKPKAIWGKSLLHVSGPITATIVGIAFVNCGEPTSDTRPSKDALAAIHYELGASVVVQDCSINGSCNGVQCGVGGVSYKAVRVLFGNVSTNGLNQPGYSHDCYISGDLCSETNCFHYGNRTGHSLKSRAKVTQVSGGYYSSIGGGRALDIPDGGKVTVDDAYVAAVVGCDANLLGIGDESAKNGAPDWTMTGGVLVVARSPNVLMGNNGGAAVFSGVTRVVLPGATLQIAGNIAVSGLNSGTALTSAPPIPAPPTA